MSHKLIIATDLDGTLLDASTYSFEAALPALNRAKALGVPVVFCSSKTRAEIEEWRARIKNEHPFISENGGGAYVPANYFPFSVEGLNDKGRIVMSLGTNYAKIREIFSTVRERLSVDVRGFGDMDVKEIAGLSGLSTQDAFLAKEREFDEPFVFGPGEERKDIFLKELSESGLNWTQGRFYHALGDNDKGKALRALKELYKKAFGDITVVALGDGYNDLPLLAEADVPVLVVGKNGRYEERVMLPNLIKTVGVGPQGWNEFIMHVLNDLEGSIRR